MGFFSWKTSDTDESIMNCHTDNCKTVYMYLPDGSIIEEKKYDGYGEFGGIDVYQWIAKYNKLGNTRNDGINATFKADPVYGEWQACEDNGIKCPRFSFSPNKKYKRLKPPETCELQGFFE